MAAEHITDGGSLTCRLGAVPVGQGLQCPQAKPQLSYRRPRRMLPAWLPPPFPRPGRHSKRATRCSATSAVLGRCARRASPASAF